MLWQHFLALTAILLRIKSHSFVHVDAESLVDYWLVSGAGGIIESLELLEPLLGRHGLVKGGSMCAPIKADLVATEEQGTGTSIAAFVVVVVRPLVFLGGHGGAAELG